jgi:hypothetical protein
MDESKLDATSREFSIQKQKKSTVRCPSQAGIEDDRSLQ